MYSTPRSMASRYACSVCSGRYPQAVGLMGRNRGRVHVRHDACLCLYVCPRRAATAKRRPTLDHATLPLSFHSPPRCAITWGRWHAGSTRLCGRAKATAPSWLLLRAAGACCCRMGAASTTGGTSPPLGKEAGVKAQSSRRSRGSWRMVVIMAAAVALGADGVVFQGPRQPRTAVLVA